MASLWADGWFYISALGFLASGVLFLYLLGQYRSSVEEPEAEENDLVLPLPERPKVVELNPEPVVTPLSQPPSQPQAKVVAEEPVAKPQSAAAPPPQPAPAVAPQTPAKASAPGYTGPDRRRSEMTGGSSGLSPAVVYLQNIKSQMERFDKEIAGLKALAAQQAAQGELVLRRLAEMAEGLKNPRPSASAGAAAAAPSRGAEDVDLSLEPAAEVKAPEKPAEKRPAKKPAPAPAPEPKASVGSATVVIEALPQQEPAPADKASEKKRPAEKPEPAPEPAPEPKASDASADVVVEAPPQEPAPSQAPPVPAPAAASEPESPPPPRSRKGPVWPV